jgi:uncharacterized SAM-binding protein YcdF (DUF218 family)
VIADAVVVLGGHAARAETGARLVREGRAPVLVLSSGVHGPAPDVAPSAVLGFTPVPFTTRGEAHGVAALVHEHDWRSVVVVTSGYHIRRSRLLFRRVVPAKVDFVAAPFPRRLLPVVLPKEAAKLAWSLTFGRAP